MIPLASSTTKYRDGILKSQHFARPFKSSQETKGKFKNGVRVGKWKYYYESGALRQVSSYSKTGQRSGKWTVYKENGDIDTIINYN